MKDILSLQNPPFSDLHSKQQFKQNDCMNTSSFTEVNHEFSDESFADVSDMESIIKGRLEKLALRTRRKQRQILPAQKLKTQKKRELSTVTQNPESRLLQSSRRSGISCYSVNINDDEPIIFASEEEQEEEQEVVIDITTDDDSDSIIILSDSMNTSTQIQQGSPNQFDSVSDMKSVDVLDYSNMKNGSLDQEPVIDISSTSEQEDPSASSMPIKKRYRRRQSSIQVRSNFQSESESECELYTPKKQKQATKTPSKQKSSSTKNLGLVTPKRRVVSVDQFSLIMRRTPIKSRNTLTPSGKTSASHSLVTTPKPVKTPSLNSPSKQSRLGSIVSNNDNIFTCAKALFQRGSHQIDIVGREHERKVITEFLESRIISGGHGALYLSGVPGTGKSALLSEVLGGCIAKAQAIESQYCIKVAEINCVMVGSASQVFLKIYEEFTSDDKNYAGNDKSETEDEEEVLLYGINRQIIDDLEKRFVGSSSANTRYVLVLDEMDYIMTRDQEVLHRLFQWACTADSRLVLVGIANALDLTNRLLPRLQRAGFVPESLAFKPYQASEIVRVLEARLWTLADKKDLTKETQNLDKTTPQKPPMPPLMHPAAIQLCARRVAANMGDLRKAFDICRRAIELAEVELSAFQPPKATNVDRISNDNVMKNDSKPVDASTNLGLLWKKTLLSGHNNNTTSNADTQTSDLNLRHQVFISHVAKACSSSFNTNIAHRIQSLSLHQKAVLCVLVTLEQHSHSQQIKSFSPKQNNPTVDTKHFNDLNGATGPVTVSVLYNRYNLLCRRSQAVAALSYTDFLDVVSVLETHGFVTAMVDSPRKRKRGIVGGTKSSAGGGLRNEASLGSGKSGKIPTSAGGFGNDCGQRRIRSSIQQTDLLKAVSSISLLTIFLDNK